MLAAAGLYAVTLLAVALWPTPVDQGIDVLGSWPVRLLGWLGLNPERGYDVVEVGANVALFVPLGFFAMVLLTHATVLRVVLGGAVASMLVELAQHLLRPERVAAWPDVLANTAGAALGAGLAVLLAQRLARHSPGVADRPIRRG